MIAIAALLIIALIAAATMLAWSVAGIVAYIQDIDE